MKKVFFLLICSILIVACGNKEEKLLSWAEIRFNHYSENPPERTHIIDDEEEKKSLESWLLILNYEKTNDSPQDRDGSAISYITFFWADGTYARYVIIDEFIQLGQDSTWYEMDDESYTLWKNFADNVNGLN